MMQKLNDIQKKNPFKVPDNYFEDVNRKIISVTSGSDHEVRKISIYNRFRTRLLVAASVTGIIIISYTAIKLLTPDKRDSRVSEILHEINPDSIINEIEITSLEENASSLVLSDGAPDVSKKDIIDYLILNNVELNDIYEQL
jgi:hypothetical protein